MSIWNASPPPPSLYNPDANICIRFLSAVSTRNILNENIRTARSVISFALSLIRKRDDAKKWKNRELSLLSSRRGQKSPSRRGIPRETDAIPRVTFFFLLFPFPLVFFSFLVPSFSFLVSFFSFFFFFALGRIKHEPRPPSRRTCFVRLELFANLPDELAKLGCKLFSFRASGYFHFDESSIDTVLADWHWLLNANYCASLNCSLKQIEYSQI